MAHYQTHISSAKKIITATDILFRSVSLFIILELLSLLGYFFPVINTVGLITTSLFVLWLTLKKREYGVYAIFAELALGNKGYLFFTDIFGYRLSLRLMLFLIVFSIFVIEIVKKKNLEIRRLPYFKTFLLFLGSIFLGIILGIINGNKPSNIFLDVNGYLFFGFLPIALQSIRSRDQIKNIISLITAGLIVVMSKTVILFFIFSHNLPDYQYLLHRWVRLTDIGMITAQIEHFHRIFLASELWIVLLFFVAIGLFFWHKNRQEKKKWKLLFLLLMGGLLSIIISQSRSLWLGYTSGLFFFFLALWNRMETCNMKKKVLHSGKICFLLFALFGGSLITMSLILNTRLPGEKLPNIKISDMLIQRINNSQEPGSSTRISQLTPLIKRIKQDPFFGSGFGTTVTFITYDPRTWINHVDRNFETFGFEWGYLDNLTETGIMGLIILGLFIASIFRSGWKIATSAPSTALQNLTLGLLAGLISLLAIHATTPFLSHPLGVGFIILCVITFYVIEKDSVHVGDRHV